MSNKFSKLLEDGWNVAYRTLPEGSILSDIESPFITIPNTWRTWEADPFIFSYKEQVYIFAEMFDYIQRRGSIGYTKWENGKFTTWKKIICESFHMSYPYVFEWNGEIYLLPETSESQKMLLYKAVKFPEQWECIKVLAEDVMWVDTTFLMRGESLYAITTDIANEEAHKDYLLRFNDKLDIIEKKLIKERCTKISRSGGRFLINDEKAIRVTQDCSRRYGEALIFSELEFDDLLEKGVDRVISQIYPDQIKTHKNREWIGVHTYNAIQQFEVIDIERRHFNVFGILRRTLGKVLK